MLARRNRKQSAESGEQDVARFSAHCSLLAALANLRPRGHAGSEQCQASLLTWIISTISGWIYTRAKLNHS